MDFNQFDTATLADKGAPIKILDPSRNTMIGDDGEPVIFYIKGQDSSTFISHMNRVEAEVSRQDGKTERTPEQREEDGNSLLAAMTTGWSDNWTLDGEKLSFSETNAKRFYADRRFRFVREQINRAIMDRRHFLPSARGS